MALALADRAIGAIIGSAVADAAGLHYLQILVTKYTKNPYIYSQAKHIYITYKHL